VCIAHYSHEYFVQFLAFRAPRPLSAAATNDTTHEFDVDVLVVGGFGEIGLGRHHEAVWDDATATTLLTDALNAVLNRRT
jgi:hypothetical protein